MYVENFLEAPLYIRKYIIYFLLVLYDLNTSIELNTIDEFEIENKFILPIWHFNAMMIWLENLTLLLIHFISESNSKNILHEI